MWVSHRPKTATLAPTLSLGYQSPAESPTERDKTRDYVVKSGVDNNIQNSVEQLVQCVKKQAGEFSHLKSALFSVVEEHEDGHLEGGDLEYVLASVRPRHLCTAHTHL